MPFRHRCLWAAVEKHWAAWNDPPLMRQRAVDAAAEAEAERAWLEKRIGLRTAPAAEIEPRHRPNPASRPRSNRRQAHDHHRTRAVMYRIREVVKLTGLSRSTIYEQIKDGRLSAVKQGRATRVTADALNDYVKLLKREREARSKR